MVQERVTCDGRSAGRSTREDSAVIQRRYWCVMKSICAVAGIIPSIIGVGRSRNLVAIPIAMIGVDA